MSTQYCGTTATTATREMPRAAGLPTCLVAFPHDKSAASIDGSDVPAGTPAGEPLPYQPGLQLPHFYSSFAVSYFFDQSSLRSHAGCAFTLAVLISCSAHARWSLAVKVELISRAREEAQASPSKYICTLSDPAWKSAMGFSSVQSAFTSLTSCSRSTPATCTDQQAHSASRGHQSGAYGSPRVLHPDMYCVPRPKHSPMRLALAAGEQVLHP